MDGETRLGSRADLHIAHVGPLVSRPRITAKIGGTPPLPRETRYLDNTHAVTYSGWKEVRRSLSLYLRFVYDPDVGTR